MKDKSVGMKKKNLLLIGVVVGIVAILATIATIFLIRRKKAEKGEIPPRKAPQLSIENPGEQSEFITSASESEIG